MITGIVIFLCVVLCCVCLYIGYLAGLRYVTFRMTDAFIKAMFDCHIDYKTINQVIEKSKKHISKRILEE